MSFTKVVAQPTPHSRAANESFGKRRVVPAMKSDFTTRCIFSAIIPMWLNV